MKTIYEVKYELLKFFKTQNSINIKKDHKSLDLGEVKDNAVREGIVYSALSTLCEQGIVRSIDTADDRWFVLEMPLEILSQDIEINYDTSLAMSEVINEYCKYTNNTSDLCDPSAISELDIKKLLAILDIFASKTEEEESNKKSK